MKRLPIYGQALLHFLAFDRRAAEGDYRLNDAEWQLLLQFCDRHQLTLLLGDVRGEAAPQWVRRRLQSNYCDQRLRLTLIQMTVAELAVHLRAQGIRFLLLKGFAHGEEFTPDPVLRSQGDIDIWCLPEAAEAAQRALSELGFYAVGEANSRHLAPMIREKHWNWTGNYFQPDLPIPIDLHHTLWDGSWEGIPGPDERAMWERQATLPAGRERVACLDLVDTLAFAALHSFMHILHGDLKLNRAWELAYFLRRHLEDEATWSHWLSRFDGPARQSQLIVFALAERWFGCGMPCALEESLAALPRETKLWLEQFSWSPVEALFTPNKDELWLHLSLLRQKRERARLLWRRLVPTHAKVASLGRSSGQAGAKMNFLMTRGYYHTAALVTCAARGLRWWRILQSGR